jgi:hypothetical protein
MLQTQNLYAPFYLRVYRLHMFRLFVFIQFRLLQSTQFWHQISSEFPFMHVSGKGLASVYDNLRLRNSNYVTCK